MPKMTMAFLFGVVFLLFTSPAYADDMKQILGWDDMKQILGWKAEAIIVYGDVLSVDCESTDDGPHARICKLLVRVTDDQLIAGLSGPTGFEGLWQCVQTLLWDEPRGAYVACNSTLEGKNDD